MLLADREFIGEDWFNWLEHHDIPFTIRIAKNRLATRADGCKVKLATQITHHKRGRRCTATLDGMARPLHFAALKPKDGEWVIVATNRAGHDALATYRKRWAIDLRRENDPPDRFLILLIFGNTKTRDLNFEDTRLTDPGLAAPPDGHRGTRCRLVRPRRQNLPRPRRPAPKDPRISRTVVLQDRLHLPAKPPAIRPPRNPRRMDQPPKNTHKDGSRVVWGQYGCL